MPLETKFDDSLIQVFMSLKPFFMLSLPLFNPNKEFKKNPFFNNSRTFSRKFPAWRIPCNWITLQYSLFSSFHSFSGWWSTSINSNIFANENFDIPYYETVRFVDTITWELTDCNSNCLQMWISKPKCIWSRYLMLVPFSLKTNQTNPLSWLKQPKSKVH